MNKSKYLKTSQYAKLINVTQRTVIRNFHAGRIKGFQDPETKTIYILNPEYVDNTSSNNKRVILYARVSSSTNKKSLDGQIERMRLFATAKGYTIVDEVKEIASGLNDKRSKFNKLLVRDDYDILLGEHKDRITRFGYNYLDILLQKRGIKLEVINQIQEKDNELMDDFVSLVTSFCNRIYGRRRKDKTKQIIEDLKHEEKTK